MHFANAGEINVKSLISSSFLSKLFFLLENVFLFVSLVALLIGDIIQSHVA